MLEPPPSPRNSASLPVLGGCNAHSALRQRRHDAVVDRVEATASKRGFRVIAKNQTVDDSRLRSDLVIEKDQTAVIIDVTVAFENRRTAFDEARKTKVERYSALKTSLESRYREVTIAPVVVGSLGTWDPQNDKHLRGLATRRYLRKMKRITCC